MIFLWTTSPYIPGCPERLAHRSDLHACGLRLCVDEAPAAQIDARVRQPRLIRILPEEQVAWLQLVHADPRAGGQLAFQWIPGNSHPRLLVDVPGETAAVEASSGGRAAPYVSVAQILLRYSCNCAALAPA